MLGGGAPGLAEAVEGVAAEDIDDLTAGALGEDLVGLRGQIDRLETEFARRLRLFHQRHGYRDDGAPSLVSWLRNRCRMSSGAAMQRVEVAMKLPELPEAEAMFRCGKLGLGHATVLARVVSDVGATAARIAEGTLLEAARVLDPSRLRLVARHLRQCVDPDGALAAALRDHARRYLHLSQTFDGVYVIDGLLDAEGGATLKTALNALS
ncbi:MAG: DUF222 domain-containing protein [Candidatus Dormibacteraeota bacterium]|nr:DUF222 domain-containing protein [Candidatus Dormibacteraeota bacterium]MBV9526028.1 DUF222 domain-containing protein [Candidatus Dormibacteraeota bacterium]